MMTLRDMKKAVDTLSPEERNELREYIEQQTIKQEIEAMLADESPESFRSGTLDMDRLRQAAAGMWADLDENEIDSIVTAMTEKNIKSNRTNG